MGKEAKDKTNTKSITRTRNPTSNQVDILTNDINLKASAGSKNKQRSNLLNRIDNISTMIGNSSTHKIMTDSNITLSKSIKDSSTLLRSSKIPTNHTHLQHSNTRLTSSTSPPPTNSSNNNNTANTNNTTPTHHSSSNSRTSNTNNTSSISLIPSSHSSSSSSSMVSSRHCGHHLASNNSNGHLTIFFQDS